MARVQVTTRALADLERLFDFLADHYPKLARERMVSVRRAFELLADHPLLGRQAEDGRRELILSRGRFGYVAKYRWVPAEDVILILAVRHQLEAGYKEDSDAVASSSLCARRCVPSLRYVAQLKGFSSCVMRLTAGLMRLRGYLCYLLVII